MQIKYFHQLNERQIEAIAKAHFSYWVNFNKEMNLDNTIYKFKNIYTGKTMPFGIALFHDNVLVGFCVLKLINLIKYKECTPWISDVLIFEEFRGMGYGKELIKQAEYVLKQLGYNRVYVWTDQVPDFYKKLDYKYEMKVEKNEGGFGELFSKKI